MTSSPEIKFIVPDEVLNQMVADFGVEETQLILDSMRAIKTADDLAAVSVPPATMH